MVKRVLISSVAVGASLLAAAAIAVPSRGASTRLAAAAVPSALGIAQSTVGRYFAQLDEGRGAAFCGGSLTAATLAAEGGIHRCIANIDGYVKRVEHAGYPAALLDMEALFYDVADGVESHCPGRSACPSSSFGRWANEAAQNFEVWRTGSDPRRASNAGRTVVVDPAGSNTHWITLYYQAVDGRIFKARWSTVYGSWRGSVVDTHAGPPWISRVAVTSARLLADGSIRADVAFTVGTAPRSFEDFRLVREGGAWRADTWKTKSGGVAA